MMDGWKLVPVELLERATRDFTGRPSWDALEDIRLKATEELRAILNAPTPPSFIACHVDESCGQGDVPPTGGEVESLKSEWMDDGDDGWGHRLIAEVYRAEPVKLIVTRLQAELLQEREVSKAFIASDGAKDLRIVDLERERDALKAEMQERKDFYEKYAATQSDVISRCNQRRSQAESELTKARELLVCALDFVPANQGYYSPDKIKRFLAQQSEPAAKGESDE